MCTDTIGHRTQKLKLKEENENGFHARLVERIEDHNLHASILNPATFNEMCKYRTVSAMTSLEAHLYAVNPTAIVLVKGRAVRFSFPYVDT